MHWLPNQIPAYTLWMPAARIPERTLKLFDEVAEPRNGARVGAVRSELRIRRAQRGAREHSVARGRHLRALRVGLQYPQH